MVGEVNEWRRRNQSQPFLDNTGSLVGSVSLADSLGALAMIMRV